jgi:A/G-specific adenine glycosylase
MKKHANRLSRWFAAHHRAMPWRETRDPYLIWISEVMLQQTQVTTVLPYYQRFTSRFPTVEALAAAEEPEVLALWSGLGYYSRARNLHRGAKTIAFGLGGKFPRTREALLEVPGIGPYTAGAISSIAFDLPEPLVDGNVQRVLSRFHGWEKLIESTESRRFFWEKAEAWVKAADSPRILNQALMELGATVCIKGTPRCGVCPLSDDCTARREGRQTELPARKPRREKVDVRWIGLVLERDGKVFLRPNRPSEWWSGLWDFPRLELGPAEEVTKAIGRLSKDWQSEAVALGAQKHTVTHHRLSVVPAIVRLKKIPARLPKGFEEGRWIEAKEVAEMPISSLARKILRAWRNDSAC